MNGRCETDNHGKTIGDVFARRKTKTSAAQTEMKTGDLCCFRGLGKKKKKNCFLELLASACNCFSIGEVGNVRFQIDYLCGCWSDGKDATHSKNTFFCCILLVQVSLILMFLLHLINEDNAQGIPHG